MALELITSHCTWRSTVYLSSHLGLQELTFCTPKLIESIINSTKIRNENSKTCHPPEFISDLLLPMLESDERIRQEHAFLWFIWLPFICHQETETKKIRTFTIKYKWRYRHLFIPIFSYLHINSIWIIE